MYYKFAIAFNHLFAFWYNTQLVCFVMCFLLYVMYMLLLHTFSTFLSHQYIVVGDSSENEAGGFRVGALICNGTTEAYDYWGR